MKDSEQIRSIVQNAVNSHIKNGKLTLSIRQIAIWLMDNYKSLFTNFETTRSKVRRYVGILKTNPDFKSESKKGFDIKDSGNIREVYGTAQSLDELIEKSGIDLSLWECYDHEIIEGEWDVASKWRDQDLKWSVDKNGNQVMEGYAKRKNEFITTTNRKFHIKAKFRLKPTIIYKDKFKEELIEDIKQLMQNDKVPLKTFNINKNEESFALEICRFDLHYGKLIWGEETGGDHYDTKIAKELYEEAGQYLLNEAKKSYKIDKIVLPLGNDIFNSDNNMPYPQTTKGTPQQEDLRWQKTFRNLRMIVADDILNMSKTAKVVAPFIPGNHDWQKSFFLGDALECLFMNNPNIEIDNNANLIKYFTYGNTLIGFVHDAEIKRLCNTMQYDKPDLWAKSKFREWHLGHIHHSKKMELLTEEDFNAITVRWLRTLMPTEGWENEKQYRSMKGAEAFMWSKNNGLHNIIQFNI